MEFLVVLKVILWFRTRISLKVSRIKLAWSAVIVKKQKKDKTMGPEGQAEKQRTKAERKRRFPWRPSTARFGKMQIYTK